MLLEAAAPLLRGRTLELHIVGDGPEKPALEVLIERLGVAGSVHLHGWLPHADVQNILRECDFLALPSVREFGGGVVLEAMALGVTPIVADYAGPSELVEDSWGIRIPFSDSESLIRGLRYTLTSVSQEPEQLDRLGINARRAAAERFTWQAKAKQIEEVYNSITLSQFGRLEYRSVDTSMERTN